MVEGSSAGETPPATANRPFLSRFIRDWLVYSVVILCLAAGAVLVAGAPVFEPSVLSGRSDPVALIASVFQSDVALSSLALLSDNLPVLAIPLLLALAISLWLAVLRSRARATIQSLKGELARHELTRSRLAETRLYYDTVLDSAPDAILITNAEGKIVLVNRSVQRLFGYSSSELIGSGIETLVPEALRARHMGHRRAYLDHPTPRMMGERRDILGRRRDGSLVPVDVSLSAVKTEKGLFVTAIARDLSPQRQLEHALQYKSDRLAEAQRLAHVGSWEHNIETDEISWTDEVYRIFEVDPQTFKPTYEAFLALVHPEDRESLNSAYQTSVETGRPYQIVHRLLLGDNRVKHVDERGQTYYDNDGRPSYTIGTVMDVTERVNYEQALTHRANHDELTGLANRNLLMDRLEQAIIHARRYQQTFGVLFLDLDQFKLINNALGHSTGDRILTAVAERLTTLVRSGDTVARLGGDEFVIVVTNLDTVERISIIANRILESVAEPVTGPASSELQVSCSIGISLYPQDAKSSQTLLSHADAAMFRAKELGRNKAQFFSEDMKGKAREWLSLSADLRGAVERGEFALNYQPQANLVSGKLTGMEALLRWHHPRRGILFPADFISIAESVGLMYEIGAWVLRTACEQAKTWRELGLGDMTVAVNMSMQQLWSESLCTDLQAILSQTGMPVGKLELEITETLAMENAKRIREQLSELKTLGVTLTIDDFGTGYSSLAYLQYFPFDKIKIDKSFISSVHADANQAAIVEAILSLAHTLKLSVIAEGVENEQQLVFLTRKRCDEIQGYYLSKPMPAELATQYLQNAPNVGLMRLNRVENQ